MAILLIEYNDKDKTQIGQSYVRLMFHGGAREDPDNNAFKNACDNVKREYTDVTPKVYKIEDGEQIVKDINSQKDNSIQSIDIFSYSGTDGIYVHNSKLAGKQNLYKTAEAEDEDKRFLTYDYTSNLSNIDYKKFTNSAKIEMHGCNTANDRDPDNFACVFSRLLYNAGKKKSIVIGHNTKATPNLHKTLKGSDYRHGVRRVYHNGKELFFTAKEGRITAKDINVYLK